MTKAKVALKKKKKKRRQLWVVGQVPGSGGAARIGAEPGQAEGENLQLSQAFVKGRMPSQGVKNEDRL